MEGGLASYSAWPVVQAKVDAGIAAGRAQRRAEKLEKIRLAEEEARRLKEEEEAEAAAAAAAEAEAAAAAAAEAAGGAAE